MSNCLDCGYLCLIWEDKEYELDATRRKEMPEILEGVAAGGRNINRDPRYLSCFRKIPNFPGKEHPIPPGLAASKDARARREHVRDMKKALDALRGEWDCRYFTSHQPGMKASDHIEVQTRQEWEDNQEQARRDWEEKQEQARRNWEEKQQKRSGVRDWVAIVISVFALATAIALRFLGP
jgi:hypothetical protein